ncbi:hypothetical protein TKWG_18770 [Advenella kashmirensis WT001]|uniref:Uncharacterized protein n=1 Tax=Advenella kashmirensis (strain DSM 17095 / LMG 22695 / WT001) TaxID=1036672 RepID=I3UEZ9_ADVKW|nr:hypothetical protein TKWG_18770 [Advenella kashmirensis WT001]
MDVLLMTNTIQKTAGKFRAGASAAYRSKDDGPCKAAFLSKFCAATAPPAVGIAPQGLLADTGSDRLH